jgi:hypothetical protein
MEGMLEETDLLPSFLYGNVQPELFLPPTKTEALEEAR